MFKAQWYLFTCLYIRNVFEAYQCSMCDCVKFKECVRTGNKMSSASAEFHQCRELCSASLRALHAGAPSGWTRPLQIWGRSEQRRGTADRWGSGARGRAGCGGGRCWPLSEACSWRRRGGGRGGERRRLSRGGELRGRELTVRGVDLVSLTYRMDPEGQNLDAPSQQPLSSSAFQGV
jgi:hypothetical protein